MVITTTSTILGSINEIWGQVIYKNGGEENNIWNEVTSIWKDKMSGTTMSRILQGSFTVIFQTVNFTDSAKRYGKGMEKLGKQKNNNSLLLIRRAQQANPRHCSCVHFFPFLYFLALVFLLSRFLVFFSPSSFLLKLSRDKSLKTYLGRA